MTNQKLAEKIVAYMGIKGYEVDTDPGHVNIVYLEGANPDATLNSDAADGWNDLSLIITFDAEKIPKIAFSAVCTTEPGKAATFDSAARRLGGVARIALGQYTAWRVGFHKQSRLLDTHPALVQCAPVPVHRDSNRDGLRIGDPVGYAHGINQHGTAPSYRGGSVGRWSAGCLVRQWWADHLRFMEIVRSDPRYQSNARHVFSTTIIAGDDFFRTFESESEMKAPA